MLSEHSPGPPRMRMPVSISMQCTRRRQDIVSSSGPPIIADDQLVWITAFDLRDQRADDDRKPSIPAFGDLAYLGYRPGYTSQ